MRYRLSQILFKFTYRISLINLYREVRGLARRKQLKIKREAEKRRVVGDIKWINKGILTYNL